MSRITNMQEAQERYAESSMVLPLEELVSEEQVVIDSSMIKEGSSKINKTLRKSQYVTDLTNNFLTPLALVSRICKKAPESMKEELCYSAKNIMSSISKQKNLGENLVKERISAGEYISKIKDLSKELERSIDFMNGVIGYNSSVYSYLSEVNQSLDNLLNIDRAFRHIDKPDNAFEFITLMYRGAQRDKSNNFLNDLIDSFDDFEQFSETHCRTRKGGKSFEIHKLDGSGLSHYYLISEENETKGTYKLYLTNNMGGIKYDESHDGLEELDKARRKRLAQFMINPAIQYTPEESFNIMDALSDEGYKIEDLKFKEARRYRLRKSSQIVHSNRFLLPDSSIVEAYRNGSPKSVEVYTGPGRHIFSYSKTSHVHNDLMH